MSRQLYTQGQSPAMDARELYDHVADPFGDSAQGSPNPSLYSLELTQIPVMRRAGSSPLAHPPQKHEFRSYFLTEKYVATTRIKCIIFNHSVRYERPWAGDKRLGRIRYSNWIVWTCMFLALPLIGYLNYNSVKRAASHDYCLVLDEDFKTLDPNTWNQEVQVRALLKKG
jgi:hypothetical protein